MIALVAVWRWLAGLPRIVLVIALAVLLLAAALWFTYHAGDRHGQIAVQRHALADSIATEVIVNENTKDQTDSARAVARFAKKQADTSRGRRALARAAVDSLLSTLPEPVVNLIRLDDQLVRRDSVAFVAYTALDAAALRERETAAHLDTIRQHQTTLGIEPRKTHHARTFVAGAAIGVASVLFFHLVVR